MLSLKLTEIKEEQLKAARDLAAFKASGGKPIGPGTAGWLVGLARWKIGGRKDHLPVQDLPEVLDVEVGGHADDPVGPSRPSVPNSSPGAVSSSPASRKEALVQHHEETDKHSSKQPPRKVRRKSCPLIDDEAGADDDEEEEDDDEDDAYESSFIDDHEEEDDLNDF